jgi:hypothetical protein
VARDSSAAASVRTKAAGSSARLFVQSDFSSSLIGY